MQGGCLLNHIGNTRVRRAVRKRHPFRFLAKSVVEISTFVSEVEIDLYTVNIGRGLLTVRRMFVCFRFHDDEVSLLLLGHVARCHDNVACGRVSRRWLYNRFYEICTSHSWEPDLMLPALVRHFYPISVSLNFSHPSVDSSVSSELL